MPKQVDHADRRRLIAEAVCELADEHGLEGVTLRDVAARAQVSMGAVQRCFRTKEEMLVFALGYVGERIGGRVRSRLLRSPAQSAATTLGLAATEVALLREEHRAEARVWLAFVAQAAVTEALMRPAEGGLRSPRSLVRRSRGGGLRGLRACRPPRSPARGTHPPGPGGRSHHARPHRPPHPADGPRRPRRPPDRAPGRVSRRPARSARQGR